jgi:hypothetical protein
VRRGVIQAALQLCGTLWAEEDLAQRTAGTDPDHDSDPDADAKQGTNHCLEVRFRPDYGEATRAREA